MNERPHRLIRLARGIALLWLAQLVPVIPAQAQDQDLLYTALDVGPWGSPRFTGKAQVNEAGNVAGKGPVQGYLWVNGVSQDLGLLTDGTYSDARGISDGGYVAGTASIDNNAFNTRAFRWKDGVIQGLVSLSPDLSSEGHAVNDAGQVAGWSYGPTGSGGIQIRAFRSTPGGVLENLGTLPLGSEPSVINSGLSFAYGINDLGQVVGESDTLVSGEFITARHAFLWENNVMQDLGLLPGGTYSIARDINNVGQVVGLADTTGGQIHAFLWQNGVMTDLGTLGGFETVAEAINDLGQIVGYAQLPNNRFHAFLYENSVMKDLNNLIENSDPLTPWAELTRATDINNRGDITGLGDKGSRRTFLARKLCRDTDGNANPDNDGDGLCDNWETDGIDEDGDGGVDLRLYDMNQNGVIDAGEQADPNHKDLYVEIDWMALHQPEPVALARVIAAFANAPVDNPDGVTGIRLHLVVDEQASEHVDETAFADDPTGPSILNFDDVKLDSFGTALERGSMNPAKRLAAKRLAFRYAFLAHKRPNTSSGGRAELPGNDFIISPGGYSEMLGHRTGNVSEQAVTFMHEFGHTLNLHHGGGDDFNCKPNYLSIMSYSRFFDGGPIVSRPLDYSREKLPTLTESALNEPVGILGPAGSMTAFGPAPLIVFPGNAPINWNRDGDFADIGVAADVNQLTNQGCDGEGDVLESQNDWSNLLYDFRASSDFADGVHATVVGQDDELTLEEALQMSPDTDGDGITNVLDNCMITVNANQADIDQDGVGNACDNCPTTFNPGQEDADDDGTGDACPGPADTDGDGIADTLDNCINVANANQRDTNADGYGNLCDADLNNAGGLVNLTDLALFRAAFGTANADADFDGNGGLVNLADFARFRAMFGAPPGPSGLHPP